VKLIGLALILLSPFGYACTCVQGTLQEKVDAADYVYIGKVVSSRLTSDKEVESELIVSVELKSYPDINTLNSFVNFTSCDMDVTVGYEYVVYGNYGKAPSIGSCSSTQPVAYNIQDLDKFIKEVKSIANK